MVRTPGRFVRQRTLVPVHGSVLRLNTIIIATVASFRRVRKRDRATHWVDP
jgi:hypothetical protein